MASTSNAKKENEPSEKAQSDRVGISDPGIIADLCILLLSNVSGNPALL